MAKDFEFSKLLTAKGGAKSMLDAEITRIRECESKADELQRKAKNESKRILDDARMEAERIIKDAEDNARKIHDRLVDEGRIEASAAYDSYMDSIRQECVALADQAKQSEDEAIEMIAERIVGRSVDH